MSSGFPYFLSADPQEFAPLRGKAIWAIVLGAALTIIGALALAHPVVMTKVTMTYFGILLLISGVLAAGSAIWARGWGGFFLQMLVGLLYLFIGVVLVERPMLSPVEYTLFLAVFFV